MWKKADFDGFREKERNRSAVSSKWNKCRIYVGDQLDRWNELKEVLRVQTHAEVAKISRGKLLSFLNRFSYFMNL